MILTISDICTFSPNALQFSQKPSKSKQSLKSVLRKCLGKISFYCILRLKEQQSIYAVCILLPTSVNKTIHLSSFSLCKNLRLLEWSCQLDVIETTKTWLNPSCPYLRNNVGNEISV